MPMFDSSLTRPFSSFERFAPLLFACCHMSLAIRHLKVENTMSRAINCESSTA
jgi:hypothetical protein